MKLWLTNLKIRNKLLLGFGLLTALVLTVALVGYRGLAQVNGYLVAVHDDHFKMAQSLAEVSANLSAVNAHLVGMMTAKDRAAQEKLHEQIRALTKTIDAALDAIIHEAATVEQKSRVLAVQDVWQAFRYTRDGQLIPAIYANRIEEARAIATGVQAKRYAEFSQGVAALVLDAQKEVLRLKEESARAYDSIAYTFLVLSALAVLLGLLTALIYARMITAPVRETVAILEALGQGDADLTTRLPADRRDELGEMARAFNRFMDKLHNLIASVRATAQNVASASAELSAGSDQLASGAQEQASSIEETAASLETITATVKQTALNAARANKLSLDSRDVAERGGQVVTDTVASMSEINNASKKIAEIIGTIDAITFQTNILALNAAVEAARAGEQGRGFAVVAAEVRSLAQRSAASATEIKALIDDSLRKVGSGSTQVHKSGETLLDIVAAVNQVSDIVAEITTASYAQSSGIEQLNKAVAQMDHVTQGNAAQTEELSSTAQALATQAQALRDLVGRFKLAAHASEPAPFAEPAATPTSAEPPGGMERRRPTSKGAALRGAGTAGAEAEFKEF
jgi:methyl-accepting chemotaxis protein